ncbi:MAG TPA: MBL fold metallo-hydrolase [Anaeromyxobacteraceae bacterium]|nr:MBL fold metallo-hydrolase [Anaeromyxobacteraceae bacterium]
MAGAITTEADLAALGVTRIPVPVPFPQAGGPVNVYAIEDEDGVALYDSGLGSPEGEAALAKGLGDAGWRFEDVTRIVVSHGHVDHYGAARTVLERAGRPVPIYAHPDDIPKMSESGWRFRDRLPHYAAYFLKLGVPAQEIAAMSAEVSGGFKLARRIPELRPLAGGEVLRFRRLSAEVLHMPGHTPGLVCLHDAERRLLFAADHLLEKISPNPIIELGADGQEGTFRPLVAYIRSISKVRALDLDLVLPGHGPAFTGHRGVIDGLLGFYRKRQSRILEALAAGPLSGYEIARVLFPAVRVKDLFLVMSETVANVEVLEARGEVRRSDDGTLYRYALAA